MAEMKTPYGLVVGLILTPPVPVAEKEQDAPAESADKPKRTRKSKSE